MTEYKVEILADAEVSSVVVQDTYAVEVTMGPVGVENGGQPTKVYLPQAEYDALVLAGNLDPNTEYNTY